MRANILLADDNEFARTAIKSLLKERSEFQIYAEAVDGQDAVEKARARCPDLAILDIEMPRKSGLQAAREILKFCPTTIILTDSLHDVRLLITQLKEAGVRGFVSKDRLSNDLIPGIETVLKGGTFFGEEQASHAGS